jgi:hypothetical protein
VLCSDQKQQDMLPVHLPAPVVVLYDQLNDVLLHVCDPINCTHSIIRSNSSNSTIDLSVPGVLLLDAAIEEEGLTGKHAVTTKQSALADRLCTQGTISW